MDFYPNQFSREARNRVETENIEARRELDRARRATAPAEYSHYTGRASKEFELAFLLAILRVFSVFAEEAVNLCRAGTWDLAVVDRQAREFLRRLTINFYYEEGRDRSGNRVRDVVESNWDGSLAEWVWVEFKKLPAWSEYEDLLLSGTPQKKASATPENRTVDGSLQREPILTTEHHDRIETAKREMQAAFAAHEMMRETLEPSGWRSGPRAPNAPTMAGELLRLEEDIRKYAIELVNIMAESYWHLGYVKLFREYVENGAREIVEHALAMVNPKDVSLLDTNSIEAAVNKEKRHWIDKAQREFTPTWMRAPEVTQPVPAVPQSPSGKATDQAATADAKSSHATTNDSHCGEPPGRGPQAVEEGSSDKSGTAEVIKVQSASPDEGAEICVTSPPAGVAHKGALEESSVGDAAGPNHSPDFSSEAERNSAVAAYIELPVRAPEDRLSRFKQEHPATTLADLKYSARVYTAEFQDWRQGKLKPDSVMSKRIEDVLSGATPLKKKPRKPRPE